PPVAGLTGGHVYHFRLVATSDAGAGTGADKTFSLGAAPIAATTAATSVGTTSAKLNGQVGPNGQDTSWHFEYGTSTSYGSSTPARRARSGAGRKSVSASRSGPTARATYPSPRPAASRSPTAVGGPPAVVRPA